MKTKSEKNDHVIMALPSTGWGGAEGMAIKLAYSFLSKTSKCSIITPKTEKNESILDGFSSEGGSIINEDFSLADDKRNNLRFISDLIKAIVILKLNRPSKVMIHMPYPTRALGLIVASAILRIRTIILFQLVPPRFLVGNLYRKLMLWAQGRKQTWVCVSESNRQRLAFFYRTSTDAIKVINNGVTISKRDKPHDQQLMRKELGIDRSHKLITTVGRLAEQKGYDLIIPTIPHIVKDFPEVRFVWIGNGELEEDLKKQVKDYNVEPYVIFAGWREDVFELLKNSTFFLFPSRYEGFPIALLESLAMECPVITSTTDGADEIITHKKHGLIFKKEDSCDLMEKLRWALKNPDEMKVMAEKGSAKQKKFSEALMLQKLKEEFHSS